MAKKIKVEDAVGEVLIHDITKVDGDKFKGRVFKKGHIIQKEDIEVLKNLGKDHIYILEIDNDHLHENDAAYILADALMGENTYRSKEVKEGKLTIYSDTFGVCKINVDKLIEFNSVGEPSCPTIYNNTVVKKGAKLAAVRIISLIAPKDEVEKAANIAKSCGGIVKVVPFKPKKAGLIITGNEVYKGRIKDKFEEKLRPKLKELLCEIEEKTILPDNQDQICDKIKEFASKYDMVILTGGTSVDPDDVTYKAIHQAGVKNYIRGNPIQPGNMLTMGWIEDTPVVAVPAAALFFKRTAFDIWLPRLLIGEKISKSEVINRSHGGLLEAINGEIP
ncbi:MAG: molybdopterin-binding protein [Epsilonproteobacteria bacterium]|nr:molybdopterin-binding protein [Campylobacterota bacterium]